MKKSLLFLIGSVLGLQVWAATSSSLFLSGTAPLINDLSISANANATALNILGGETKKLIATATEESNCRTGYSITMVSLNGGELRHQNQPTKKTNYTITYNNGAAMPPGAPGSPVTVKTVALLATKSTAISNIHVSVDPLIDALAGTYSDTLTFSIVAN